MIRAIATDDPSASLAILAGYGLLGYDHFLFWLTVQPAGLFIWLRSRSTMIKVYIMAGILSTKNRACGIFFFMQIDRNAHGYVFGKGTKEGFDRMKKRGAILPPFSVQDNVTRIVNLYLGETLAEFDKVVTSLATHNGAIITDSIPKEFREIIARLKTVSMISKSEQMRESIDRQLYSAQRYFFRSFLEDAPERIAIRVQFGLDADEVFKDRIQAMHDEYLDTALQRIGEGESWLRMGFITELTNWIEGKSDLSGLPEIMAGIRKESGRFSQYFARDQFSRFNRALTTSSFHQAGVRKFRWFAVGDQRTRHAHKMLHNNVFDLDNPPTHWKAKDGTVINVQEEMHAYNCRCVRLAVFED